MRYDLSAWTLVSHQDTRFHANLLPFAPLGVGLCAVMWLLRGGPPELALVAVAALALTVIALWLRRWTREVRVRAGSVAITSRRCTTIFPAAMIDRVVTNPAVLDLILREPVDGMWLIEFMPIDADVVERLELAMATSRRAEQLAKSRRGHPLREYG